MSVRACVVAWLLLVACRPSTSPVSAEAAAEPDPRDVTRAGDDPPMYRPSSSGPLVAITRNAYGAYGDAPKAPQMSDTLTDFELPTTSAGGARGGTWSLREARAKGPVVLVFYRGFW
jgi:hypothetical protein